jgi:polar amino acid transport system substrate-binding protein
MLRFALLAAAALIPPLLASQPAVAAGYRVLASDRPPYAMDEGSAEPGFCVEVAQELGKRAGIKVTVEFMPWARAQEHARQAVDALLPCINKTKSREDQYSWIAGLNEVANAFFTMSKPVNSMDEAKAAESVTVILGSEQEKDLGKAGLKNIEAQDDPEVSAKMLEAGRVDVWYVHDLRALYIWRTLGFDSGKLVMGKKYSPTIQYLAGHKDIPAEDLKKFTEAYEALVKDGSYDKLYAKYFGAIKPAS